MVSPNDIWQNLLYIILFLLLLYLQVDTLIEVCQKAGRTFFGAKYPNGNENHGFDVPIRKHFGRLLCDSFFSHEYVINTMFILWFSWKCAIQISHEFQML
jgi:hypothetical protein